MAYSPRTKYRKLKYLRNKKQRYLVNPNTSFAKVARWKGRKYKFI